MKCPYAGEYDCQATIPEHEIRKVINTVSRERKVVTNFVEELSWYLHS